MAYNADLASAMRYCIAQTGTLSTTSKPTAAQGAELLADATAHVEAVLSRHNMAADQSAFTAAETVAARLEALVCSRAVMTAKGAIGTNARGNEDLLTVRIMATEELIARSAPMWLKAGADVYTTVTEAYSYMVDGVAGTVDLTPGGDDVPYAPEPWLQDTDQF